MKTNSIALALIFCLTALISCKKESTTDPEPKWEPEAPMPKLPDATVDIYMSGLTVNQKDEQLALYWKNGNPVILGTAPRYNAECRSIAIVNNDVYATAILSGISPRYWKNGSPNLLTDPLSTGSTLGIAVSGTDIYVAGQEWNGNDGHNVYWKNGQRFELDSWISFASVAALNGDFYVVGND